MKKITTDVSNCSSTTSEALDKESYELNSKNMKKENWKLQFDDRFQIGTSYNEVQGQYQYATKCNKDGNCDFVYSSDIKQFISNILKQQKHSLCAEHEKTRRDQVAELHKEINTIKENLLKKIDGIDLYGWNLSNQKMNEIIKELTPTGKKI